ncbi:MAG TPA: hypothetical protein PKB06_00820 [Actinotalea sp.]|nr:hypothetical protein [Actinotalea sp.]
MSLQESTWGSGQCHLQLGWDDQLDGEDFHPAIQCTLALAPEHTGAIPGLDWPRPDGYTTQLPGIVLLDPAVSTRLAEQEFVEHLTNVVATPIADLLDRAPSIVDMVPLLTTEPWLLTRPLRTRLANRGVTLPPHQ